MPRPDGPLPRQRDLQNFLREARARVDPAEHGLERPSDRRGRQVPGLTQPQMDVLLHSRTGTYGSFERGAKTNPSTDYLDRLARYLKLGPQEWESLWRHTYGHNPPYALDPEAGLDVAPVWRRVVHEMTTMAYISNVSWDLLEFNSAFAEMFPDGRPPSNVMRWMLLDDVARDEVLLDWENSWAPVIIPQLVAARHAHPADRTLQKLERDVHNDPRAARVRRKIIAAFTRPDSDDRPLRHAALGPGRARLGAAEPLVNPGARLMVVEFEPDRP
ncbi:XRE family transcriptional regulator [Streptomyces ovatisporus]|uniref:XRE family transcriptional regulator n=1 Tax=Streptomyces ovatisporus TaxID=1128682 RepID=A0ABV9A4X2_9ACTN